MKPTPTLMIMIVLSLTACSSQIDIAQTDGAPSLPTAMPSPSMLPTSTVIPSPALTSSQPDLTPTSPNLHTPTSEVKTELVTFTTQDKITLSGTLFGEGDMTVILAHMGMPGVDQQSWQPFAQTLAERGFSVLTFDFRGRGESSGKLEQDKLSYDMEAAIQYLNEIGYTRIVCMGASMGGTACMRAAADHELVGLGVIASTMSTGVPNEISADEVQLLSLPKLLVYGAYDFPTVVVDMKKIIDLAPEPKFVQVFQTYEHGTDLFKSRYSSQFSESLIHFLESLRPTLP